MSVERDLLRRAKCLLECSNMEPLQRQSDIIIGEIKELLEQLELSNNVLQLTEQEPVAWMYEWYENDLESTQVTGGSEKPFEGEIVQPFNIRPLYTAPPEREPLTRQQISVGNQSMLNVTRDAFVKGVKWAEKAHGIGGKE